MAPPSLIARGIAHGLKYTITGSVDLEEEMITIGTLLLCFTWLTILLLLLLLLLFSVHDLILFAIVVVLVLVLVAVFVVVIIVIVATRLCHIAM